MNKKIRVVFDEERLLINAMNNVVLEFEEIDTSINIDSRTVLKGNAYADVSISRSKKTTGKIISMFKRDIENLHSIAEEFEQLDSEISYKLG